MGFLSQFNSTVGLDRVSETPAQPDPAFGERSTTGLHGFADAVAKKPRGVVRDLQRTVHLMGGNALLAAAHQMNGLKPLEKLDMALLRHGAQFGP